MLERLRTTNLRADLTAGLTTAVVSLPLALSFGVASGVGPQSALYGAILVGFFAALFGGTTRLISEPTGPMTVIMTAVIAQLTIKYPEEGLAMAFTVVMVAGLFQILIGKLKLGQFVTLMPYSVISGFMSGIGVILVIMQIPGILGAGPQQGGVIGNLRAMPELIQSASMPEVILGIAALLILFLFPAKWKKRIPPQLVVLVLGTLCAAFLVQSDLLRKIGDEEEIVMGLPNFVMPTWTSDQISRILIDGLVLGTLGAIDTLLTAMIADSLLRESHDSEKELVGQGIGNLVCGVCGALPGAGATMGTVVNIQTGAVSPLAAVFRSSSLLLIVVLASPLVSQVPLALLSAIALKVGVDILDWSFLKRTHKLTRTSGMLMYGVLLMTVFADLIIAVGVGVFVANILTIQRLTRHQSRQLRVVSESQEHQPLSEEEAEIFEKAAGKLLLFHLNGPMIFGVAKAIAKEQAEIEKAEILIIDLTDVPLMGTTVALSLENMALDATNRGVHVIVCGARGEARERLGRLGLFDLEGLRDFERRSEAFTDAEARLDG